MCIHPYFKTNKSYKVKCQTYQLIASRHVQMYLRYYRSQIINKTNDIVPTWLGFCHLDGRNIIFMFSDPRFLLLCDLKTWCFFTGFHYTQSSLKVVTTFLSTRLVVPKDNNREKLLLLSPSLRYGTIQYSCFFFLRLSSWFGSKTILILLELLCAMVQA